MNFNKSLFLILIISLQSITGCAHTPPMDNSKPYLADIDTYGTPRFTDEELKASFGNQISTCAELFISNKMEEFYHCKQQIITALQNKYHFAYADFSFIRYFNYQNKNLNPIFTTLDIVESEDAKDRMSFTPRPSRHFEDPDGLIKAWNDYVKTGFDLLAKGEVNGLRPNCPAFHCIFGHEHPKLAPYEKIFVDGVTKNKKKLEQIFLHSHEDDQRAATAFLLAYGKDGTALVKLLSKRIKDENAEVRNNIIRVFSDIASFHREIVLPIGKVIDVLNFPTTTDRNKASAVILGVVQDKQNLPMYRKEIMTKAVPILLRTLRLKQPNNHDFAYYILRLLSDKNFDERDYASWEKWYSGR